MEPPAPPDEFAQAVRAHKAGDLDGAEAAYRRILAATPDHADALNLLGVLEHQRGRHEAAIARIGRAIALIPGRPDYHNNRGVALRALGRLDEAVDAYREAIRSRPGYADALANLGVAQHEQGRFAEARASLEAALSSDSGHCGAFFALANLSVALGDLDAAIPLYRRAHESDPRRADILNNLGGALQLTGRGDEALDAYRRAATIEPADAAVLANLGSVLEHQDRVEEAAEAYAAVARLRPREPHWPIRIASLCPAVFPDAAAIDRYRIGLEAVLDAHRGGVPLAPEMAVGSGCRPPFGLAHHGRDDRDLKAKFAALFRGTFPPRDLEKAGEFAPARIGFVATRHHEGGFIRSVAGIANRIDPGRFRVAIFGEAAGLPALRAAVTRPDAEFVEIPNNRLPGAAEVIAAAGCAVLYHWQIGTDPLNYFLPFARPAPVQCTSWGTHVTSGVPEVDYYLSSDLIEPAGSEAGYTEELVRMSTLPAYQSPPGRPQPRPRRSEFMLPDGRRLYTCLQRLAKIHPDFDPLLAAILRGDPSGLVVLLEDKAARPGERLRARLGLTMPDVADRVVFLPRRPRAEYLRLLSLSDVVLDPPHYGAGFTAYDILGLGLPLVTLPGDRHVARYALGCYRKMGFEDLAADSPGRYVELAVRLGLDAEYRAEARDRIAAAAPALFEDASAVAEHGRFFERAAAGASP